MITKYKQNLRTIAKNEIEYLPVKTKYGKEVHLGRGSVTRCGVWMKVSSERMYVDAAPTCEKCSR